MPAKKPTYDPAKQYRVQLAVRVELLSQTFYPGADLTVRGDVLETLAPGAIASATPVEANDEAV